MMNNKKSQAGGDEERKTKMHAFGDYSTKSKVLSFEDDATTNFVHPLRHRSPIQAESSTTSGKSSSLSASSSSSSLMSNMTTASSLDDLLSKSIVSPSIDNKTRAYATNGNENAAKQHEYFSQLPNTLPPFNGNFHVLVRLTNTYLASTVEKEEESIDEQPKSIIKDDPQKAIVPHAEANDKEALSSDKELREDNIWNLWLPSSVRQAKIEKYMKDRDLSEEMAEVQVDVYFLARGIQGTSLVEDPEIDEFIRDYDTGLQLLSPEEHEINDIKENIDVLSRLLNPAATTDEETQPRNHMAS